MKLKQLAGYMKNYMDRGRGGLTDMTSDGTEKKASEDGVSVGVEEFYESGKYAVAAMVVTAALLALVKAIAG